MLALFKPGLSLLLGVGIAAPTMAPPVIANPALHLIQDGDPTPAACRIIGIELESQTTLDDIVSSAARVPTPPRIGSLPPPPVTLNIEPTKKEDRVEYSAPPLIVPSAPAPPAPPSPSRPSVVSTDASGRTYIDGALAPHAMSVVDPSAVRREERAVYQGPPTTERYPDAVPNPVKRVADEPVSTFAIDVDTSAYANVRRFIDIGIPPPADAVRVEELINVFDYGYTTPTDANEPFAITTATVISPWSKGRQIVHIGLQGYELSAASQRPLNLTFLVDVSGSMQGADRLDLAKRSMNMVIDRLRPQDTVAITYYASGAGTTLTSTPGTEKLKLRCAVASLNSGGGTAGAQGLANAYDQAEANLSRDKVNRILMFTDGDFNVGVTADKSLEDFVADKRKTGIYLSIYGYGRGNYQDARIQAISQAGNGTAGYVSDLHEARRLFGSAFDKGAFPIADDVKIQVEFNPARVSEYRLIGYETRLLNEADFNNDAIDAGEVGSGASVTALYEITPVGASGQITDRRYDANRAPIVSGDPNGEIALYRFATNCPANRTRS